MTQYPTGTVLDLLLEGGFQGNMINQIYGSAGSGKTNIALLYLKRTALDGGISIFIDTEGVSATRFAQIIGEGNQIGKRILVAQPKTPAELTDVLKSSIRIVEENITVTAVVVDSIANLYRESLSVQINNKMDELISQMSILRKISHIRETSVLITNQVYYDASSMEEQPLGGMLLHNMCKAIYRLEKHSDYSNEYRKFVVVKHSSIPRDRFVNFVITAEGIAPFT